MALIAVDAVVDVPVDSRVLEVVGVVSSVATRALKNRIVARIDVAGRAHIIRTAVVGWEPRVLRVVERGVRPTGCVMATLAGRREELWLCGMAGIARVVVIGLMAPNACSGQGRVIAVDVTLIAVPRWRRVRTGKRKCSVVVIEG